MGSDEQPVEVPAEVKDVLLAAYKEHADDVRQNENHRERMTTLIIAIGAGALGLAAARVDGMSISLLGVVLVVLGLYGAVFSFKQYERSRRHAAVLQNITDRLVELYPQTQLTKIREEAHTRHAANFPGMERLRLYHLWIGLPLMVSVVGVVLILSHGR